MVFFYFSDITVIAFGLFFKCLFLNTIGTTGAVHFTGRNVKRGGNWPQKRPEESYPPTTTPSSLFPRARQQARPSHRRQWQVPFVYTTK